MRVGTENKRQVYLLGALCAVIVGIGAFELHGAFDSKPVTHVVLASRVSNVGGRAPGDAIDYPKVNAEPKLRIHEILRTERVEYSAKGRNIFSLESAPPVQIETPIAPPRPVAAVPAPPPEPPKPPAIDIKYLGYTQGNDKIYNAILVHGEDSLMARSGDIIFHRYKVGSIQPASVQVTDLSYNRTQTISITDK